MMVQPHVVIRSTFWRRALVAACFVPGFFYVVGYRLYDELPSLVKLLWADTRAFWFDTKLWWRKG